jgi:hypothetical protein
MKRANYIIMLFLLVLITIIHSVHGATYFCDPVEGNTSTGDGSAQDPWGSLQSVVEARKFRNAIQDGDTVFLMSGFHGKLDTRDMRGDERARNDWVTLEGAPGERAQISFTHFSASSYWRMRNIEFSPSFAGTLTDHNPKNEQTYSILGSSNTGNHHFEVENCRIFSTEDASNWTSYDWTTKTWVGIKLRASHIRFVNNTIFNVFAGIEASGPGLVADNLIQNYSCDGMRVGGRDLVVQDNKILDIYNTDLQGYIDFGWSSADKCHADAIQGGDGNMRNVTMRRNTIIARTDPDRPTISVGGLQGVFLENSYLSGVIENNVIIANNPAHGITVGELDEDIVENLIIRHNTITDPYGMVDNHPNIHFQGGQFANITIINNIAGGMPSSNPDKNIVSNNNIRIEDYDPDTQFVDFAHGDMRLAEGSDFIDSGATEHASSEDLDGNPRAGIPDCGAYEFLGCTAISDQQMMDMIEEWKNGSMAIQGLISAVLAWKEGC